MSDVTQSGNVVAGNIAGRDHITIHSRPQTLMSRYNAKLADLSDENPESRELIDALLHYATPIDGEIPIGLAEKLRRAGRERFLQEAERLKERFAKRLLRGDLSETAQQVLLFGLTRSHQLFKTYISPLVGRGASDEEIIRALESDVVYRLFHDLEENRLDLMIDEIEGMVWFLTGNCFIDWMRNA